MSWRNQTILLGFYQGIGDFLSAVPVINALLQNDNRVVIVASAANRKISELIDFAGNQIEIIEFTPFSTSAVGAANLFRKIRRIPLDHIIVSPHAQKVVSSWKLPLLLWLASRLNRHRPDVLGSMDEKLSGLYDRRFDIDKRVNLVAREWSLNQAAGSIEADAEPDLHIFKQIDTPADQQFDLVIHPGASRPVKTWPVNNYGELVARLGRDVTICFVGMKHELEPIETVLAGRPRVHFRSGSLADAVKLVAGAKVALTMDSGFSHIAAFLGVRHFAVFGSTNPAAYPPMSRRSTVLYRPNLPCQPCDLHTCPYRHMACMDQVSPTEVAASIGRALEQASSRGLALPVLV